MNKVLQFYFTLRHIKPIQFLYRFYYSQYKFIFTCKTIFLHSKRKITYSKYVSFFIFKKNNINKKSINFLNKIVEKRFPDLWNDKNQQKLWLYNLHYFDGLNASEKDQRKLAYQLLQRWVKENPPFKGNGWEPYPLSLRIVNIIKYLLANPDPDPSLNQLITKSLYLQARRLSKTCEYHLLGNHLFENYKALCFAGLYFDTDESKCWFDKGLRGIKQQIAEQVLADGGHFELSPMYHAVILEGLLDLQNVFTVYGLSEDFIWKNVVKKMLQWLWIMQRPNGELPYFNDTANGMVSSASQIFDYAKRLGYVLPAEVDNFHYFADSGYLVAEKLNAKLILDIAALGPDYLPGHGHADSLSFELYLSNMPVLVNLGTSCYEISERRLFERGTAAHNTVMVDQENSSEVWSSFRVARRAKTQLCLLSESDTSITVTAQHDGYTRLHKKMMHRRTWDFSGNGLRVSDRITYHFKTAYSYLHLHPGCDLLAENDGCIVLQLPDQTKLELKVANYHIIRSKYAQSFGQLLDTYTVVMPLNPYTLCGQFEMLW